MSGQELVQVMTSAAEAGGKISAAYFGQQLEVTVKSAYHDFQTRADVESEQAILQALTGELTTYNIHAEESGVVDRGSARTLIIDPLDGSHNFISGLPLFSVNLALVEDGQAIAGVIHQPITGLTISALRGSGLLVNGKPLSKFRHQREQPTVIYNCGYHTPRAVTIDILGKLYPDVGRMLSTWAPGPEFCLFASGGADGYISNGTEVYDFVAGKLFMREAGALVSRFNGQPDTDDLQPYFVAAYEETLHNFLVQSVVNVPEALTTKA